MPQSAVNCVTIRQRESIPQCQWRQWSFNQMEKVQISADGSRPLFVNCSFMSMRNNMKTTSAWDLELPARLSYAPARFCPLKGQVGAILPSGFFIIIHHPSSIIHPVAATIAVFGDVWGHQAGQRCVIFTCSSLRKLGRAFDTMI